MSWSGYLGETGQMLAVSDIGDRPGESLSGSGKPLRVVAIDPDTGKVVRTLFELDLANQPVADRSGTHILVKSANALYRWSEGNDEAIKVADNILAAQWVPAAAQEVSTTTTSNESDAAVAFRSPPKATWGGVIEFREDGSIRADGFNEYIVAAQPSWKSDPRAAALALFDISEGPTPTTLEPTGIPTVEVADNSDGAITVSITTEVPGDDSVSGSRQTATLTRADDGTLRLVRGTWAQRCIRGDSPEAFVAAICP
jgi:hypothetical protein